MINHNGSNRDNSIRSCLSSFLQNKGEFYAERIQEWKPNVFFVEDTSKKGYILKSYVDSKPIIQQWRFFEQFQSPVVQSFCSFPNGEKMLKFKGKYWTLQSFSPGNKLRFQYEQDRRNAVDTVKIFHEHAQAIQITNPIKRVSYEQKCQMRLRRFWSSRDTFDAYGYSALFHDIVHATSVQIRRWSRVSHLIDHADQWIHGDLAGHNFLQEQDGRTRLIDLDLLGKAPFLYDFMQLGQRYLDHIDHDIHRLLSYNMCRREHIVPFLIGVSIPIDIMREWLHFMQKQPHGNEIIAYLTQLEKDWDYRKQFMQQVLTF
ncbi:aminoglycoside phosphotransferase family protein [Radiobacillus kanasensis]|uniref:phosphotransferase n=1 Tax=Radiobacillus kanasensis TaxID=2844358 RepID=UPI001E4F6837|nr:phosphotransferase [Radiobacillus kanasensis]UFT97905.1 aminoglycoside phosphotransferase family protein [Radiobacillus kanasensis]